MASGISHFEWKADVEFFGRFENSEILDADVQVFVGLRNRGTSIDVSCEMEGSVTVPCDRCLEDLVLPVEAEFEETYVPESDELDMSQDVYDYVMTSLPMQRIHAEGDCNDETIKHLSK
ncbi:MAG: DUF177 domain-containing protein [Bacteroidales bacterium]|nr:DUF177 domain-containing protein [Bacteroidales bacterium]